MPKITGGVNVASTAAEIAEEQEKGYRGARVDPNPNSAYSQETDPTTSPGHTRRDARFIIDPDYMDPDNPDQEHNHSRLGLDDTAYAAELADLQSQEMEKGIAAVSTATGTKTTRLGAVEFDGDATGAKLTLSAQLVGSGSNNRTFAVVNKTKGLTMYSLTTTSTVNADTPTTIPANGAASNRKVSKDDEIELQETITGTGVTHASGSVLVNIDQQDKGE